MFESLLVLLSNSQLIDKIEVVITLHVQLRSEVFDLGLDTFYAHLNICLGLNPLVLVTAHMHSRLELLV